MNSLRVGWFLALRQIKRSSVWTTLLIIFIMTLTFLNLVVVGGILVGLTAGASLSYEQQYSGQVFLRNLMTKEYIEQSENIIRTARSFPEVLAVSGRYIVGGKIEANYKTAVGPKQNFDSIGVLFVGLDPDAENAVTGIGERLIDGEDLKIGEEGYVLLGKNLVEKYTIGSGPISMVVLRGVDVGSKVRINIAGHENEFTVKGIVKSKVGDVSTRVYMIDSELRRMIGRSDKNVDEIAIRIKPDASAEHVRDGLKTAGFSSLARIETSRESQGTFLDDIEKTFMMLSNVIGGIGIIVASITIFIVIFINAVTRRKYIGILKGIGVSASAIEISYVLQSIFYAFIGSGIGLVVVYTILKPYFDGHPINFPFSDGLLVVPIDGTLLRAMILIIVTIIAGYFPARMIISKNTLDSILGR